MKGCFSKDLIALDVEAETSQDAIRILSDLLYQRGCVKDTFFQAVIDREQEFATGLPCDVCGIAIPHTDPIHVNEMAVAIGVLTNPIPFGMMGGSGQIDVDLVFLMALKDCESQIRMLQRFAEFFQDKDQLQNIRSASSKDVILEIMNSRFNSKYEGRVT